MGAIGGLVGLGGGAAGTSFQAPTAAPIVSPTSPDQIAASYGTNQQALASQQALLQALQSQNGLQNQNQVYGQLQGVASGAVNPAQAQFAQNTAQNVGNQAALMAGQRGAASNVGLIARQAAQQGAGIQQQAVGQEAAQQAQNQINAIGQAGQLATTQAGQQIGQTNANTQSQQQEQANLLGAMQGFNSNVVASQASQNAGNAALAGNQMTGQQGLIGGIMNGAGAIAGGGASGGEAVKMANGGDSSATPGVYSGSNGAVSEFGKFFKGATGGNQSDQNSPQQQSLTGSAALQNGASNLVQALGGGSSDDGSPSGAVSGLGMPSGSQGALSPADEQMAGWANGGITKDFRKGGKVNASSPKEKAVKKGNDYANDKIPAVLSEHEIVLPRSVTLSKDPVNAAAQFVSSVIAKRKAGK